MALLGPQSVQTNPATLRDEMTDRGKKRLISLDAYRGFVMLAMAASGLKIASVWAKHHDALVAAGQNETLWNVLSYQLEHVPWVGCSFWDLIQPSFMFMVGVSMPFSYNKRADKGQSGTRRFLHAVVRSLILIALGVFLSSNWSTQTNFVFTNVLSQIGLGYIFVYLLLGQKAIVQGIAALAVLGGYWYFFYAYQIPETELQNLTAYIEEHVEDEDERAEHFQLMKQYEGLGSHWNKHTNAAAAFDREFLSKFPSSEQEFRGKTYWLNKGGYATLNFIPSIATMLFGLMAGQLLIGPSDDRKIVRRLLIAGTVCLLAGMALDTHIWPIDTGTWGWSVCPTVKRIWTPTWAIFSTGWALLLLGMFYLLFDVIKLKWLAFPMAIVGMNSIAFYVMAQLMKGWISRTWQIHMQTIDSFAGTNLIKRFFGETNILAPINESALVLFTMWLIALWMYRRKLFVRI